MKDLTIDSAALHTLCAQAKELILNGNFTACEHLVISAMMEYPHAAQPHNLLGILLEKQGDHVAAMKHFRAAWALDPSYIPARQNLETYGTFYTGGHCMFDTQDADEEPQAPFITEYDSQGIGHRIRRIAR